MPRRLVFFVFFIILVAFAAFGFGAAHGATSPSQPFVDQPLPSAEAIFKRHHAALGRLPSLIARWSGSVREPGQVASYEVIAARDGRFRRTYVLPLTQQGDGSNGVVDWEQDENGNVHTSPALHHSSMDSRLVRLNDMRFEANNAAVLAATNLDGRRVYSVSVPVQGANAIVYFDAVSWLVDGADFGANSIRYRAYRRFRGVAVPVEIAENSPDENLTITVDNVDFLRAGGTQFDPPAQREPRFPAGVRTVEMSFDSPRGLIVCPAKINGHPVRLLIDSGSTTSIIDLDVAKRLALPQGGLSKVEGAVTFTGTVAKIDSLDLNGIRFEPLFVQAVPLRLPDRIAHEGIDGILGYDVFAPLVTRISYKHTKIQLIEPASFSYTGTGTVIATDTSKHVPVIGATIGKDRGGMFSVDTGSTAALVLFKRFAEANSIEFINPARHDIGRLGEDIYDPQDFGPSTASGAGGNFPTRLAVLDRLNLGSFSLADLPTQIVMRDAGAFSSKSTTDGIVGGGALAMFTAVFFDYPRQRLILER